MTERDELAFSRALSELVPDVLFYEHRSQIGFTPRRISSIPQSREAEVYLAAPDADKLAEWARNFDYDHIVAEPAIYGYFRRSEWVWPDPTKKWAFDPPLICEGNISIAFPCQNDELRQLAERITRLITKVTTHGKRRFGLDACQWSQAGNEERRGLGPGVLIDPSEKIELNKYYDDELWDDDGLPDEPTGVRV